ncbi:hypothetical protein ACOAPY_16560 [Pseudomonas sp. P3C3]
MVKVGFIVEGDTEKLIIESTRFRKKLQEINLEVCDPIINASGNGNLLPRYLENYVRLLNEGPSPDIIIVLTDLEDAPSVQSVKDRIRTAQITDDLIIVSVKAIESWFLGDSNSLSQLLGIPYVELYPEQTIGMPWDRIRELTTEITGRGVGRIKTMFAQKYIDRHGFCVFSSADHMNCRSARDFKDKLLALGADI